MDKPQNIPNQNFLAKRRQAIAEMANRRSERKAIRNSNAVISGSANKFVSPISLSATTMLRQR